MKDPERVYAASASLLLLAAVIAVPSIGHAADGASVARDKCESCHGAQGNSAEERVPSIAGIPEEYFLESMQDFRTNDRKGIRFAPEGEPETDMNEVAESLSKDDVKALADYYSKQTFKPRAQVVDKALAKKGAKIHKRRCERCHEDNGKSTEDDMGRLAGQSMKYLEEQLKSFMAKERHAPKKMAKQLKKLTPDDVPALVHFFAGQKG